jgi:hypothetical protein
MKPAEEFLNLYNNIDSLKNNQINELYIATNDLYSDVCKTDDMKKIYEKIFKNYDPKTIYTIINDPTLQNYKNRPEMIDAKKLFFISYCVLLFFKNSYNMKKDEFHEYLKTLMDRFDLDENSKLRKAIEIEIGVETKPIIVSKSAKTGTPTASSTPIHKIVFTNNGDTFTSISKDSLSSTNNNNIVDNSSLNSSTNHNLFIYLETLDSNINNLNKIITEENFAEFTDDDLITVINEIILKINYLFMEDMNNVNLIEILNEELDKCYHNIFNKKLEKECSDIIDNYTFLINCVKIYLTNTQDKNLKQMCIDKIYNIQQNEEIHQNIFIPLYSKIIHEINKNLQ